MNPIIYGCCMVVVFLLLAAGFTFLFRSIQLRELFKDNVDKIYNQLSVRDRKRVMDLELDRRRYGNASNKKNFLERQIEKTDNLLIYSGWSIKHTWLNTSTYIVINVVMAALLFLITFIIFNNFIVSFLLIFMVTAVPLFWMMCIADSNYKKEEGQLSIFIDMVANVSGNTNDLLSVFAEVAPYMAEPLRTAIYRAISKASMTGNPSDCIRQLSREMEHPLLVRFIRNLEICSTTNADYGSVARDFAPQANRFVKAAETRRATFASGRGMILALVVMGFFLMYFSCESMEFDFFTTVAAMTESAAGIFVLCVEGVIFISAALYSIFGMRR